MRRTEQQRGAREFLRQPVVQRAEGESYVGEAPAHSPWGHQVAIPDILSRLLGPYRVDLPSEVFLTDMRQPFAQ